MTNNEAPNPNDFDIFAVEIAPEFLALAEHQADIFGFDNPADRPAFVRHTALGMQSRARS